MIRTALERIGTAWQVLTRGYFGAEANRLTNASKPRNQAAQTENAGPYGADSLRSWARQLVRDNAYSWGVVNTIVANVIGSGITQESALDLPDEELAASINERRDKIWQQWCEVCDINGELHYHEIQQLVMSEIVEAGECLIRYVKVPKRQKIETGDGLPPRYITRPVPLALELIEADRLATDYDTLLFARSGNRRIVRGVEIDETGRPLAYWIYKNHPTAPLAFDRTPERIPAGEIAHLYRKDRIGQTRGVTWFHAVVSTLRNLGIYVENELQASAVSSCATAAIKTDRPIKSAKPPTTETSSTDSDGNENFYMQPGMIFRLKPHESVDMLNPSRPNPNAAPFLNMMGRGIAVGTGLSFETVMRDYSGTTYSANRASQLEDRRRFRCWQSYQITHNCLRTWDEFCDAAALDGNRNFPSQDELDKHRRELVPVEHYPPVWEWVDPATEQSSNEAAVEANQTTLQAVTGKLGGNYHRILRQRAKEKRERRQLGLLSPEEMQAEAELLKAQTELAAQKAEMLKTLASPDTETNGQNGTPSGEMAQVSTLQFNRNRKAIDKVLAELQAGDITENKARVLLQAVGMQAANIDALIADAMEAVTSA